MSCQCPTLVCQCEPAMPLSQAIKEVSHVMISMSDEEFKAILEKHENGDVANIVYRELERDKTTRLCAAIEVYEKALESCVSYSCGCPNNATVKEALARGKALREGET